MSELDDRRIQAAQADADRHGYRLTVDEAFDMPAPITHVAHANPLLAEDEGSWGRFLCYSVSVAEAAEAGAEIIRRHVELGEPWPEELLRSPPEADRPSG
jgi:tRNA A58 N-methylase Trm61